MSTELFTRIDRRLAALKKELEGPPKLSTEEFEKGRHDINTFPVNKMVAENGVSLEDLQTKMEAAAKEARRQCLRAFEAKKKLKKDLTHKEYKPVPTQDHKNSSVSASAWTRTAYIPQGYIAEVIKVPLADPLPEDSPLNEYRTCWELRDTFVSKPKPLSITDFENLPIDTEIQVCNPYIGWQRAYFAGMFEKGLVKVWVNGLTSKDADGMWVYFRLNEVALTKPEHEPPKP